jgi:glyoxylase-like metal-dependent hydrolase (beta-lactamase superfamily II)
VTTSFDEFAQGFSWRRDDDTQQRSSHALATGDGVWLIDPSDDAEALERAAALGPAAGVLQLLDRHNRACAAVAQRLGAPHLRLPAAIPGSPFEVLRVVWFRGWHEIALWWPEPRVLAVADAIGTGPYFALGRTAGMHPLLRPWPPRALRGYAPEHLLVGHGPPVHGPAAAAALAEAYAHARGDLPRFVTRLPGIVRSVTG